MTASRTTGTRTAAASGDGSALTDRRTSMPAEARTSRAAASSAANGRSLASPATRRTSALAVVQIRASSAISSPALGSSRPMSLPMRSDFIAIADRPRPRRSWVSLAKRSRSLATALRASSPRRFSSCMASQASRVSPYTSRPSAALSTVRNSTPPSDSEHVSAGSGSIAHSTGMLTITAANATRPGVPVMSRSADPARNPHMVIECQPVTGSGAYVRTACRRRVAAQPRGRVAPRDGHEWRSCRMTIAIAFATVKATSGLP